MIFITLGSQKFQFNRLLKTVDDLVRKGIIKDRVFAQTGYSDYEPQNYEYKNFLSRDEFADVIDKTDIVITHGGTGAVVGAIKAQKKVIAVPRKMEYGEHVDNHQLQLIKQFQKLNLICACIEVDNLEDALREVAQKEYQKYESNTQRIVDSIADYIDELK